MNYPLAGLHMYQLVTGVEQSCVEMWHQLSGRHRLAVLAVYGSGLVALYTVG